MPDEPEEQHDQTDSADHHTTGDDEPAPEPEDGSEVGGNAEDEATDVPTDAVDHDDGSLDDTVGEDVPDRVSRALPASIRNSMTLGQLTLHYPSRDVTVFLDGAAALRTLKMFEQRRERCLADLLDPELSSAGSGWLVVALDGPDAPLAMSWVPGLPTQAPRTRSTRRSPPDRAGPVCRRKGGTPDPGSRAGVQGRRRRSGWLADRAGRSVRANRWRAPPRTPVPPCDRT